MAEIQREFLTTEKDPDPAVDLMRTKRAAVATARNALGKCLAMTSRGRATHVSLDGGEAVSRNATKLLIQHKQCYKDFQNFTGNTFFGDQRAEVPSRKRQKSFFLKQKSVTTKTREVKSMLAKSRLDNAGKSAKEIHECLSDL